MEMMSNIIPDKRSLRSLLLIMFVLTLGVSCDESEDEEELGNWVQSVDFEGQRRSGGVTFQIGSRGYVGLGYDGDDYFNDFYFFDVEDGYWNDAAPFPGVPRERAVAFAIGSKVYVGLGYNRDLDEEELRDFWEYDSDNDSWRQIADFPSARYNAVAFSAAGSGYVGTGNDGKFYLSDFWKYTPSSDSWSEVRSFPGGKREDALAVVMDDKVFLLTGRNNGAYKSDIWEYDPVANTWRDLSPDDDEDTYDDFEEAVRRHDAVGFALDGRIYVTAGLKGSSLDNATYEFTPATGEWEKRTSFEGAGRARALAFVLSGRAFVVTGQNGTSRWDDMWEFFPFADYDDAD
jgi:N-acetylneuraminic acid mutarotase